MKRRTHRGRPCHRYSTKLDRPEQHSLFQTFRFFQISRILRLIIAHFQALETSAFLKTAILYIQYIQACRYFLEEVHLVSLSPRHIRSGERFYSLFPRCLSLSAKYTRANRQPYVQPKRHTHRRNCGFSSSRRPSRESVRPHYARVWPSPSIRYLYVVSSRRAIGPRACNFCVLIPISAPKPNWAPSVKAVETLA